MSDVIVTVLKTFTRSTNGVEKLRYEKGQSYPLPANIARHRVAAGYVKLEELQAQKPAPVKTEKPAEIVTPVTDEVDATEKPKKSRRKKPKKEET